MHESPTVAKEGDAAMRPYLQSLCAQLNQSIGEARNVFVTVDCDDLELPRSRAIPIGLMVNELATNAFKHAFPEAFAAGEIRVQLRRRNGITLIVEDNGKGCSQAPRDGVGSRLIKELVGQLEGSFHREDAQPGCRVTITIPDKAERPL
jgi:two-component sensor histidine kinase